MSRVAGLEFERRAAFGDVFMRFRGIAECAVVAFQVPFGQHLREKFFNKGQGAVLVAETFAALVVYVEFIVEKTQIHPVLADFLFKNLSFG